MSTNGGLPGGAPNGFNGLPNSPRLTTGFYDISIQGSTGDNDGGECIAPPSRPSSPESGTTPRVLLGPRVAEATSRQDLLRSIPTAQPPFFGGITAYTHAPLPPRGSLQSGLNGASGANGYATNGLTSSSPLVSLHFVYFSPYLVFSYSFLCYACAGNCFPCSRFLHHLFICTFSPPSRPCTSPHSDLHRLARLK